MALTTADKLSSDSALLSIVSKAAQDRADCLNYAGNVSPQETFDYIRLNPSVVVDVRTAPEWQFVGIPDLSGTASKLLALSWKLPPSFILNPRFIDDLLAETFISKNTPLFFICRSGGRSLDAAVAVAAEGYRYCFNVIGGFEGNFEGDIDKKLYNTTKQGWKHSNLPWMQG